VAGPLRHAHLPPPPSHPNLSGSSRSGNPAAGRRHPSATRELYNSLISAFRARALSSRPRRISPPEAPTTWRGWRGGNRSSRQRTLRTPALDPSETGGTSLLPDPRRAGRFPGRRPGDWVFSKLLNYRGFNPKSPPAGNCTDHCRCLASGTPNDWSGGTSNYVATTPTPPALHEARPRLGLDRGVTTWVVRRIL